MNERIDKLLARAHIEHAPDSKAVVQKFAELIVRECAWAADFAEDTNPGDYVKKHFGVES